MVLRISRFRNMAGAALAGVVRMRSPGLNRRKLICLLGGLLLVAQVLAASHFVQHFDDPERTQCVACVVGDGAGSATQVPSVARVDLVVSDADRYSQLEPVSRASRANQARAPPITS